MRTTPQKTQKNNGADERYDGKCEYARRILKTRWIAGYI
jgi:hypothetical protein